MSVIQNIRNIFMRYSPVLFVLFVALTMSCVLDPIATNDRPFGSYRITFAPNTEFGTAANLLPVAQNFKEYTLTIQALDEEGKLNTKDNSKVCFYSNRGILLHSLEFKPLELKNGVAQDVRLRLKLAFGRTIIWVGEYKDIPGQSGEQRCPNDIDPKDTVKPPVGRVGAAPDLYFETLSIRDVQKSDLDSLDSPLKGKYALIGRGTKVVVGVTNNGFHVTDIDAYKDGRGYHSLFVFTFSAPTLFYEEGAAPRTLKIGDMIKQIEGGVDEFGGHTQIAFPSFVPHWKSEPGGEVVRWSESEMPAPQVLTTAMINDRRKMEPYESSTVEVRQALALPVYQQQEGWSQFRQWPILILEPTHEKDRAKCEELILTELYLHVDPNRNQGSQYRSCIDKCQEAQLARDQKCNSAYSQCKTQAPNPAKAKVCSDEQKTCLSKSNDDWFTCFFACRFDKNTGLFQRLENVGCNHAILLVISNTTIPSYDPTSSENSLRRFSYLRGVLQHARAVQFNQLTEYHHNNEISNTGFVIWVRQPDDLSLSQE